MPVWSIGKGNRLQSGTTLSSILSTGSKFRFIMTKEKLEKRLVELQLQRVKLYKMKAASPLDILKLASSVEKEITQLKKQLESA